MPVIVLTVNRDSFFLSHRLPIALALRDEGFQVTIVAEDTGHAATIRSYGLSFISLPISRGGLNPLKDFRTFWFLLNLYRNLKPVVVHHITPKIFCYGTYAAMLANSKIQIVNAVAGTGSMLNTNKSLHPVQVVLRFLYRLAFRSKRCRLIFQNKDNLRSMISLGILADDDRCVLIRGSGVDCRLFAPRSEPDGDAIVMLCSRLLRDKGILEFIEAASILKSTFPSVRFVLVGAPDPANPSTISGKEMESIRQRGSVEVWGHREEMPEVLALASIVVLPSYHEGLPKGLLEAMAVSRPIVTTNVPGCRECVHEGSNGFLVPPKNSKALAEAIAKLLQSKALRIEFGRAGREMVVREFTQESVVKQTLDVYRSLIQDAWPAKKVPAAVPSPEFVTVLQDYSPASYSHPN